MKINHYTTFEYWGRFNIPYYYSNTLQFSELEQVVCYDLNNNTLFIYNKDYKDQNSDWSGSIDLDIFNSPLKTKLGKSLYE